MVGNRPTVGRYGSVDIDTIKDNVKGVTTKQKDPTGLRGSRSRGGSFGTPTSAPIGPVLAGAVKGVTSKLSKGVIPKTNLGGMYDGQAQGDFEQYPEFSGSLVDYLGQAQGLTDSMYGSYDNTYVDNRINAAKTNSSRVDELMRGAYDHAISQINATRDQAIQRAPEVQAAIGASTAEAQAAVQATRDASREAQQAERVAAGMAPVDADLIALREGRGNRADADVQAGVQALAERGQTAQNRETGHHTSDLTRINGNSVATSQMGADVRGRNSMNLVSQLAALEDERLSQQQAFAQQKQGAGLSLAQQLYGDAQSRYNQNYGMWSDQRAYETGRQDTAWEQGRAESNDILDYEAANREQGPQAPNGATQSNALKYVEAYAKTDPRLKALQGNPTLQYQEALRIISGG